MASLRAWLCLLAVQLAGCSMFGMEHVPASGHDGRFVGAIGGSLGLAHGGVTALDPRSGPGVDLYADVGATFGRHGAGMRVSAS